MSILLKQEDERGRIFRRTYLLTAIFVIGTTMMPVLFILLSGQELRAYYSMEWAAASLPEVGGQAKQGLAPNPSASPGGLRRR